MNNLFINLYNNNKIAVKSVIYLVLFFGIMLTTTNCKKSTETTKLSNNKSIAINSDVIVVDNRLVFNTREDYENTIAYLSKKGDSYFPVWEKEIGFTSERKIEQEQKNKESEFDALFATLLNPERIIQIGNHVFKVDMKKEKVYVLNKTEYSNSESFKTRKYSSYSIYDNVLDVLEGADTQNPESGNFCDPQKEGYYYWNSSAGQVMYKIVYQSAGIYHSLLAKIKKDHWGGPEYISLSTDDLNGPCFARYKNHCDNYKDSDGGYDREYELRPYQSTRRLTAFRWRIYFIMIDYGNNTGPVAHSQTLEILCNESDHCI